MFFICKLMFLTSMVKTRFLGLTKFHSQNVSVYFQPLLRNRPKSYRIRRNNTKYTAITPFKVIQGHRFCYQSKAHMRLPIIVINANLHCFQVMADYMSNFR